MGGGGMLYLIWLMLVEVVGCLMVRVFGNAELGFWKWWYVLRRQVELTIEERHLIVGEVR